jgi:hypothetical protein
MKANPQPYRQGKKALRNQGLMYSMPKRGIHLSLTPDSVDKLREIESTTSVSVSEIVERLVRADLDHEAIVQSQESPAKLPDS